MELLIFGTIFAAILLRNRTKSIAGIGATLGTPYVIYRTINKVIESPVICFNGGDAKYQIKIWEDIAKEEGYKMVGEHNYLTGIVYKDKSGNEIVIMARKASVFANSTPGILSLPTLPKIETKQIKGYMKGVYGLGELPSEVVEYVESYLTEKGFDGRDISRAWGKIDRMRCPLSIANIELSNAIESAIEDFQYENPEFELEDIDAEDVFMEIEL